MTLTVMLRGGGDLASGVAYRLARAGIGVWITELAQPLSVRRTVSFSEAIYNGDTSIEGVNCRLAQNLDEAQQYNRMGIIPIIIDPEGKSALELSPCAVIDARMMKKKPSGSLIENAFLVGLGPGFTAGVDCHVVIETNRGPYLGRVYWAGSAQEDTGIPEMVLNHREDRVLRAPCDGIVDALVEIGAIVKEGQPVIRINDQLIKSPFAGLVRGMIHPGLSVTTGMKIGDVDPRPDPMLTTLISDKALAIAGGVMEALFTPSEVRRQIFRQ